MLCQVYFILFKPHTNSPEKDIIIIPILQMWWLKNVSLKFFDVSPIKRWRVYPLSSDLTDRCRVNRG